MVRRIASIFLLVALALPAIAWASDARQQAAELTAAFYAGRIDEVWGRMSAQMQSAMKSRDGLAAFREQVERDLGAEKEVIDESVEPMQGMSAYRRRARFEKVPVVVLVQWLIDADGRVQGFAIRPEQAAPPVATPSAFLDYRTRTNLRLPFDDEFHVFWGGRTVEQNYHAAHAHQRFALDLLVIRDGRSHSGEGTRNEDYYCFGRPILAPAAGKVVEVIDGVEDNVPGQMNPKQVTGNRVVIDHGQDEYSVLAHLRRGSTRVKSGDAVRGGQRIGECGNSGNSSEAHLHYQLQNGAAFGVAAALPAQFHDYLADGEPVTRDEPIKGQRIRPAGAR